MHTINVGDLTRSEATAALRANRPEVSAEDASQVYQLVGGRLAFLSKVAKQHSDVVAASHALIQQEKSWLLARRAVIPDHDDDVMDAEKESTCAWLLFQACKPLYIVFFAYSLIEPHQSQRRQTR